MYKLKRGDLIPTPLLKTGEGQQPLLINIIMEMVFVFPSLAFKRGGVPIYRDGGEFQ